jgi:hypothetical protein
MENIVPALISAASAIVVAFISRMRARTATGEYVPRLKAAGHGKWVAAMFVLAGWLIISPIAIHNFMGGFNGFWLIVLTVIVAAVWPINGWEAAAWVFALHALNLVISNRVASWSLVTDKPLPELSALMWVVFANALGVAFLSQWRLRTGRGTAVRTTAHPATVVRATDANAKSEDAPSAPKTDTDFSLQLERLARLRDAGGLSEAEFAKAKQKILGPE